MANKFRVIINGPFCNSDKVITKSGVEKHLRLMRRYLESSINKSNYIKPNCFLVTDFNPVQVLNFDKKSYEKHKTTIQIISL